MSNLTGHFNNQTYIAKEISNDIPSILKKHPKGTVHSVFNTSFNLIFEEHIIHIGSKENGQAPFGIGLEKLETNQLTKQMQIGMKVTFIPNDNNLIFGNECTLQLNSATEINHSLKKSPFEPTVLAQNIKFLCESIRLDNWTIGFVQTEEEKQALLHYLINNKIEDTDIIIQLHQLSEQLQGMTVQDITTVFNYWMGRGAGLTPSGDDILTGASAMLTLLQGETNPFLLQLKDYLLANGRKRTTPIAYEYLVYAVNQKYHSHLLQLCKQLIEQDKKALTNSLKNLLQVGHTSGADTLIGIIIASKAYLQSNV